MLELGIKATINSDDPAYFRAYLTDNFLELQREGDYTLEEVVQLNRNAFDIAWLADADKQRLLGKLDRYVARAS